MRSASQASALSPRAITLLIDGELRSSSYLKHVNIGVDTITVPHDFVENLGESSPQADQETEARPKKSKAVKAAA